MLLSSPLHWTTLAARCRILDGSCLHRVIYLGPALVIKASSHHSTLMHQSTLCYSPPHYTELLNCNFAILACILCSIIVVIETTFAFELRFSYPKLFCFVFIRQHSNGLFFYLFHFHHTVWQTKFVSHVLHGTFLFEKYPLSTTSFPVTVKHNLINLGIPLLYWDKLGRIMFHPSFTETPNPGLSPVPCFLYLCRVGCVWQTGCL